MSFFATEFPVSGEITQAQFMAQAIAWVKGMVHSTLFDGNTDDERFEDHAQLLAESGESLTLKRCEIHGGFVSGVRHEFPDSSGLVWRSEIVLTHKEQVSVLRAKGQCLVSEEGAFARTPRKPYFITMAIDDGWAERDDI